MTSVNFVVHSRRCSVDGLPDLECFDWVGAPSLPWATVSTQAVMRTIGPYFGMVVDSLAASLRAAYLRRVPRGSTMFSGVIYLRPTALIVRVMALSSGARRFSPRSGASPGTGRTRSPRGFGLLLLGVAFANFVQGHED